MHKDHKELIELREKEKGFEVNIFINIFHKLDNEFISIAA